MFLELKSLPSVPTAKCSKSNYSRTAPHNVQQNFNGSNTDDGSSTTAVSNSFLSP